MPPKDYYMHGYPGVDRELYATAEEWAGSFHLNGPCPENLPASAPIPVVTKIQW